MTDFTGMAALVMAVLALLVSVRAILEVRAIPYGTTPRWLVPRGVRGRSNAREGSRRGPALLPGRKPPLSHRRGPVLSALAAC